MKVFITGLNGFLARNLAGWLSERGYFVTGTTRTGKAPHPALSWHLGDPINKDAFDGIDVVIHAAHDFTPGAMMTNINGSLSLERVASDAGVKRQILISSLSARPDAVSEYGRTKFTEEEYFLGRDHTIVRPGTVLGKGGVFGKLAYMLQSFPLLPLLDGGRTHMTVIGIQDFCRAMEKILEISDAKQYNLYYEHQPTLGELLRLLSSVLNLRTLFIPVPAVVLLFPLTVLRYLRIRTPVDVDNLRGYITGLAPFYHTNLSAILPRSHDLQTVLAESWGKSSA